jgi:hypothetical protein
MPIATLHAFADHGDANRPLDARADDAAEKLRRAEQAGLDLAAVTSQLEREGVRSFCDSYVELLTGIETAISRSVARRSRRSGRLRSPSCVAPRHPDAVRRAGSSDDVELRVPLHHHLDRDIEQMRAEMREVHRELFDEACACSSMTSSPQNA